MNALRPLISRILAPFVGAFVVWLSRKVGFDLPGVDVAITELIVFAITTGVTHKTLDRTINPLDTAKMPEGGAVREALATGTATNTEPGP